MSFLAKFGLSLFAAVVLALIAICLGVGLSAAAFLWVGAGILAAAMVACIALLVANEVYEARNNIPFQLFP